MNLGGILFRHCGLFSEGLEIFKADPQEEESNC